MQLLSWKYITPVYFLISYINNDEQVTVKPEKFKDYILYDCYLTSHLFHVDLLSNIAISAYYYLLLKQHDCDIETCERAIMNNCTLSYNYAVFILNDRFLLGESTIAKHDYYSYLYAKEILKDRFELGEQAIANSEFAISYAINSLKGRFELYESILVNVIIKNSYSVGNLLNYCHDILYPFMDKNTLTYDDLDNNGKIIIDAYKSQLKEE